MSDKVKVEEKLQPETFNFIDVLSERSFPKDEISIYLDEASAYQAKLVRKVLRTLDDEKKIAETKKLLSKYNKAIKDSEYKFKLSGVSIERIEDLLELAKEKYPIETKTRKTASGSLEQYEVPNPSREEYFGFLTLWIHVEAIVAPDGRVQTSPDVDTIISFIKNAPQSQVEKFANAIKDLQVSSRSFEEAIDDDFLAKP